MLIVRRFSGVNLRSVAARSTIIARDFSDSKKDDSDSDSDKETKKQVRKDPVKEETASDRLNKLLASMQTDDNLTFAKGVNMAKPGASKIRSKKEDESKNVFEAVKKVASHLGEDTKQQTEAELLTKLLNHSEDHTLSTQSSKSDGANPNELSLSELIVGMKIDRRQPAIEHSRGDYVRKTLASHAGQGFDKSGDKRQSRNQHKRQPEPNTGSVNLFGSKPLDIFKDPSKLRDSPDILTTWQQLNEHELKLAVTHPPTNHFQKMALWTEQGKLWKFPIDNEQGMDEEAATDFSEHVFLEQYLEPWCPTKGPIRHFMELVCVGLSKNPYIGAKEKKAHILWYRDYFEEKKDILKETIVDQKDASTDRKKISTN